MSPALPLQTVSLTARASARKCDLKHEHKVFKLLRASMLFVFVLATLVAANVEAASKINTLDKEGLFGKYKETGIAIRGYDTVAYFTQGMPVKGVEEFQEEWEGASWWFSSAENAELFRANPSKYAPQYGGYCAYGVAEDYLVKIEPDQWQIVDDKLYLNFDKKIQKRWQKDITGYIERADNKIEQLLEETDALR